MLLAAIVRAVCDFATVVVKNAYSGTTNIPPAIEIPKRSTIKRSPAPSFRNVSQFISSTPTGPQWLTVHHRSRTNNPIMITDAGAYFADTAPFRRRLTAIEPMAIPIEKNAVNRVATVLSPPSAFLTMGGKIDPNTAPIPQKKLIAIMARNRCGTCMVSRTSRQLLRTMFQSIFAVGASFSGGATGTDWAVTRPMTATRTMQTPAIFPGMIPPAIEPANMAR